MFLQVSFLKIIPCFIVFCLVSGCFSTGEIVSTSSGLIFMDNKMGNGPEAEPGDSVSIHFKGWVVKDSLYTPDKELNDMISIGNTYLKNRPIDFVLGENTFIKGSDEGIAGMKEGGIRTMIIPSTLLCGGGKELCYSDSNLKLIVELVHLKKIKPTAHR